MKTLKQAEKYGSFFFLSIKSIDGLHILLDEKYYKIILDSLDFCRRHKGLEIYAYAILINHLHLVVRMKKDFSLSQTIGDFKKFTAHQILKMLKSDKQYDLLDELIRLANKNKDRDSKVWRRSCWPEELLTQEFFMQKVEYTDGNPIKHGVAVEIESYPYTSYHNHYCDHDVVLEIDDIRKLL